MTIDTRSAINSLTPGAECTIVGTGSDEVITWLDSKQTQPTTSEINAEITRLQTEYNNNKYQRDRAAEYPSVVDQLDDIYHNGIDAWKATIKTTKDKYPK
tara:strand:+ start:865 stop:1164 length:300 start_codon:yes stop_codon:yes gene_type:complete